MAALELVEAKLEQVGKQKAKKVQDLLKQHLDKREPLLKRRYELVNGAEPTPQELQGYGGPAPGGSGAGPKGVPCFWLNVLCADETVGPTVTAADREALRALQDVRYVRGARGMVVELHFGDNPFFTNKVLRRGMAVEVDGEGQVVDVREETTAIDWHDGASLLVREVGGGRKGGSKKKGKKGKKGADHGHEGEEEEGGRRKRYKPAPSFFRFFTPLAGHKAAKVHDPTAEADEDEEEDAHGEDDDEEQGGSGDEGRPAGGAAGLAAAKRHEADSRVLEALIRSVVPGAVHLYESAPALDDSSNGGDDEDGFEVVGGGAAAAHGGGEALAPSAQRALHALKSVQAAIDAECLAYKTAKWDAAADADAQEQALLDERRDALARKPSSVRCKGGPPATSTTIPLFWLRALRASETTCLAVARRDERALAALADVRLRWDWSKMPTREQNERKCTVEWHFLDNPYFGACVLRKAYTFSCAGGSPNRLDLERQGEVLGEGPQWRSVPAAGGESEGGAAPASRDLTVRVVAGARKPKPTRSLFNMFKKGHLPHVFGTAGVGGDSEAAAAALQMEEQVVGELMAGPLRLSPLALYAQVEVEEGDVGDEEHEEDELDEDDDEGEDGSGDEAARGAAAARRRAKKGDKGAGALLASYLKPSKNCVLLSLLGMVGLAQVLMALDMLFGARR